MHPQEAILRHLAALDRTIRDLMLQRDALAAQLPKNGTAKRVDVVDFKKLAKRLAK